MLELEEADYIQILQASALSGLTTQAFIMRALKNEIDKLREVVVSDTFSRNGDSIKENTGETTSE